ncbi:hypothetical protein SAMD00023353_0502900 [Rosellinia necatrix]|uniref:Uncharacterized protein n=1 Tax=Rosellinia necatrix TaxID=77044 RepID=A0A1S8A5L5_ROSNE|nr:hypothetical protein SAMD00023353_0502900 [Rosellinia necatrix]
MYNENPPVVSAGKPAIGHVLSRLSTAYGAYRFERPATYQERQFAQPLVKSLACPRVIRREVAMMHGSTTVDGPSDNDETRCDPIVGTLKLQLRRGP